MCEELSYQVINTSAVNQAVFYYYYYYYYYHYYKFSKINYKKENVNVSGSEQRRDALF